MSDIKLSIITATYNAAEHLPRLIESLLAQTDQDFEWVVADGGSTDGTLELLEQARPKFKRLIVDSRPDFGIYDALNRAIKTTAAEYYLVCGADDELDRAAVNNYKKLCVQTNADILTAAILMNGVVIKRPGGPSWLYGQRAYVTGHAVGAVFRKSLHERVAVGYYSNKFSIAADQLFVKRAVLSGATVAVGNFLAGKFGVGGVSSVDRARVLTEFFCVQLETEKHKNLQIFLFMLRLIKNYSKLLY